MVILLSGDHMHFHTIPLQVCQVLALLSFCRAVHFELCETQKHCRKEAML